MICKDKLAQSAGPVVTVGDESVRFAVSAAHQRAVCPPKRLPRHQSAAQVKLAAALLLIQRKVSQVTFDKETQRGLNRRQGNQLGQGASHFFSLQATSMMPKSK